MIRRSRVLIVRPSASTPASTMTRRSRVYSIAIRCSVEWAVALRDESAADGTGPSLYNDRSDKMSDFARFAEKALR